MTEERASHGSLDPGKIHLARDRINWDGMELDPQVCCTLIEGAVGGRGHYAEGNVRFLSNPPCHMFTFRAR